MYPILPPQSAQDAFLTYPDIHGDKVVFTCESDLWLGSISTGNAVRLTRHEGKEYYAKFSPDGTQICFTASYDGIEEIYTMPVSGGAPKRVTFRHDYAWALGWNNDGSKVFYRARSFPRSFGLYTTPKNGGPEAKLPLEFASMGTYSSDSNSIAFTRFNRDRNAWFRYIGGMKNQIWVGNLNSNTFKQITNETGTCEFPAWVKDKVYYVTENQANFQIKSTPANGGRASNVGSLSEYEIRELEAGPDALVYERGMGIEMIDLNSGETKPLKFNLQSDMMHTRNRLVPAQNYISSASLTPTGKRVLVETRGQIVTIPAGEGEARIWKSKLGVRLQIPSPSPDGEKVAYVSDESGEQQIYISDIEGNNPTVLTTRTSGQIKFISWSKDAKWIAYYTSDMEFHLINTETKADQLVENDNSWSWSGPPHEFSPDSKFLAYVKTTPLNFAGRIAIRDLSTGETKMIGNELAFDSMPTWSQDGKYLAYASRRSTGVTWDSVQNQMNTGPTQKLCLVLLTNKSENPLNLKDTEEPKPKAADAVDPNKKVEVKIDWEGLEDRTVVLPPTHQSVSSTTFSGSRLIYGADGSVRYFDLASKKSGVITPGGGFGVSADGKKLLVGDRVVDATGTNIPPTAGKLNSANLMLTINTKAEWNQMFYDAWRLLRDYFYVKNMHGVDWNAIKAKYEKLLPAVRSRDELDILIRWMQAELGSSHQYLRPGETPVQFPSNASSYLGIDVEPDPVNKKLKISNIIRGDGIDQSERSPLLVPGFNIKEGDYLLEIGGRPLDNTSNYLEYIANRPGQTVSVTVSSKADGSDKRTVLVKTVGNENRMRILDWVQKNRDYVTEKTNGEIGYIYLQAMSGGDMSDFLRQYYPQRNKKALIIDTRFNNGGSVQSHINNILSQKISGFFNMRGSKYSWSRQGDAFSGPVACIINEFNVSCGEEFPHRFQDLGIGKVIGRRTYGGEVGSSPGWLLADGGVVSVPNYGMWTPEDGWVIEGEGVKPDIDVESDPNLFVKGIDPQLDRTIAELQKDMQKKPIIIPIAPPDRDRVKKGMP